MPQRWLCAGSLDQGVISGEPGSGRTFSAGASVLPRPEQILLTATATILKLTFVELLPGTNTLHTYYLNNNSQPPTRQ